ncbi:MAG: alpha/beta hydrolase [Ilumatobacteraceae bacterium]
MSTPARQFVLVHGAWCGSWVWRDVVEQLAGLGHRAAAPTLTGLGERSHLLSDDVGLTTHVDDIVGHIEFEDLTDVDLVGWSYGGMVITGVLARIPQRIRSAFYLDAFVPTDGQSLADLSLGRSSAMAHEHEAARTPFPIREPQYFGVTDEAVLDYCRPRLRPQPWKTMVEPVAALAEAPAHVALSYVLCRGSENPSFRAIYDRLSGDPRWTMHTLTTNHFAPLTDPGGVTRLITAPGPTPTPG